MTQETDLQVLIKTPSSALVISTFSDKELLEKCVENVSDKFLHHPPIVVFGKVCRQRRDVAFFSNESKGYQYSGQMAASQPLTPSLLSHVNSQFQAKFNGILVNRYSSGEDYISAHSDDEKFLDSNAGVVSVSYGKTRIFRIREKFGTKKIVLDLPVCSFTVIHMSGSFQKEFTHEIPRKLAKGDGYTEQVRVSFTFRSHSE